MHVAPCTYIKQAYTDPPSSVWSDGKNVLLFSTGGVQEPKTCLLGHREPIDGLIWLHNSCLPTCRADYMHTTLLKLRHRNQGSNPGVWPFILGARGFQIDPQNGF